MFGGCVYDVLVDECCVGWCDCFDEVYLIEDFVGVVCLFVLEYVGVWYVGVVG